MSKIGRNNPCVCGSGEKYKRCCLAKNAPASDLRWGEAIQDSEWMKIRQTEGQLIPRIIEYAKTQVGPQCLQEAWNEFTSSENESMGSPDFEAAFIPWFAFNYEPEFTWKPIARSFLDYHLEKLSPYEIKYLLSISKENFSFYVVLDASPGLTLDLKDILLDREVTVKERKASHQLSSGDLVFGRVLSLEGQSVIVGMTTLVIPSKFHFEILDFRDGLKKAARKNKVPFDFSVLTEFDFEIREFYHRIRDSILNPPKPIIQNTDGDLMEWTTSRYKIDCPPEVAHKKLATLTLPEFREVFKNASKNEVLWQKKGHKHHGSSSNTNLGTVVIELTQLITETNSRKRNEKLKKEIQKRLGSSVQFLNSETLSMEEMMKRPRSKVNEPVESIHEEALPAELVKELTKNYWDNWLNQKIPALKNKTPLEAAKTEDGRERLQALLMHYNESDRDDKKQNLFKPDIQELKIKLGMEIRSKKKLS